MGSPSKCPVGYRKSLKAGQESHKKKRLFRGGPLFWGDRGSVGSITCTSFVGWEACEADDLMVENQKIPD